MTTATAPMSLKLRPSSRERLNALASIKQRPAHALAREAVEAYIEAQEQQDRQNRESMAAWNHYQETGLHAAGEDVTTWIESWGTSNELPAPKCNV
jgi:predicted transcriptional regulator